MGDFIDTIIDMFKFWGNNLRTNLSNTFDGMTVTNYIRMIAIVGAYLLIRPYIMKLGAKIQEKEHEKQISAEETNPAKAKISPNSLRGKVEIPDDTDEEEDPDTSGANWGKKARKRQRNFVKRMLEEEERRAKEIEDALDDDIKEFLED
ncbi:hypothetical protein B7463_g6591, partial [Scytalidium lignicola]